MIRTELWRNTADPAYDRRRIPGLMVTSKGTLIFYNEARQSLSDWAMMDIVCRRSEDHGLTFGEDIVLARGTEVHPTVNNPVMMEDRLGRIHLLYCEDYAVNGGRVLRRTSSDDGRTWSEPIDISAATRPEYHNVFALGPGHGIRLKNGALLVPVWLVPKSHGAPLRAHAPSETSTLYSLDDGETWQMGEILSTTPDIFFPNETVAAELSDGSIYLAIRNQNYRRAMAVSPTGWSRWHDYRPLPELTDPICFGSVAAIDRPGKPHTLLFGNCACNDARRNVTLRASFDDGKSWPVTVPIDPDRGGYVEVNCDSEAGLIYVLYEENAGEALHLVILSADEVFSLQPSAVSC